MCAKTPKPKKVEEKPVQFLRNPFLDDINIGQDKGRNSLRIDLAGPSGTSRAPTPFEGSSAAATPKTPRVPRVDLGGIQSIAPGLVIPTRQRGASNFAIQ